MPPYQLQKNYKVLKIIKKLSMFNHRYLLPIKKPELLREIAVYELRGQGMYRWAWDNLLSQKTRKLSKANLGQL